MAQRTAQFALRQTCPHFADCLHWLYCGIHGLPVFPDFDGLANRGDLLRASGLVRLSAASEFTLARFDVETSNAPMDKFAETCLASALPPPGTSEQWKEAMRRDREGRPMHCGNYLSGTANQVGESNFRANCIDLDQVRLNAAASRAEFF